MRGIIMEEEKPELVYTATDIDGTVKPESEIDDYAIEFAMFDPKLEAQYNAASLKLPPEHDILEARYNHLRSAAAECIGKKEYARANELASEAEDIISQMREQEIAAGIPIAFRN